MSTPLERPVALLALGAGGGLAAASVLFSAGASNGPLVWVGAARPAGGVRLLVRALDPVVDRARPLVGLPEPRSRLRRVRARRARGRGLRPAGDPVVGLRAGGHRRAPPRVGAAREGRPVGRRVRADRSARLACRLLERARAALRFRPSAVALAGRAPGAPALAPGRGDASLLRLGG